MNGLEIDRVAAFGSPEYLLCVLILVFGRGMDLLSTWMATPTLVLEANPMARWLGWRAGVVVNLIACVGIAMLPLAAVSVATMSVMVASRNLQSAWLIRVLGEHEYRGWIAARYREAERGVFLICLVLHASLLSLVGAILMIFSRQQLVPFGVGFGMVTYAVAVAFFTFLGMRRAARKWTAPEVEIPSR
jgi:hypothetical protein